MVYQLPAPLFLPKGHYWCELYVGYVGTYPWDVYIYIWNIWDNYFCWVKIMEYGIYFKLKNQNLPYPINPKGPKFIGYFFGHNFGTFKYMFKCTNTSRDFKFEISKHVFFEGRKLFNKLRTRERRLNFKRTQSKSGWLFWPAKLFKDWLRKQFAQCESFI